MTLLDEFFSRHGNPHVNQEERDSFAVRCGLLPHHRFLTEIRPSLRAPASRANGHTTQQLLSALVRFERGDVSLFLGAAPTRDYARMQLLWMAENVGLDIGRVRAAIRFLPDLDFDAPQLRGLEMDVWVVRL